MTDAEKLAALILIRAIDSSRDYIVEQKGRECPDCKTDPHCGTPYATAQMIRRESWKPGLVMGPEWVAWLQNPSRHSQPGSGAAAFAPCPRCNGTAHVGAPGPIGQAILVLRNSIEAP